VHTLFTLLFAAHLHRFERMPEDEIIFVNQMNWIEVSRDYQAFLALLGEVLRVLDAPTPPDSSETCGGVITGKISTR
jgi:hypothetical protein